jgi:hypothetical protein
MTSFPMFIRLCPYACSAARYVVSMSVATKSMRTRIISSLFEYTAVFESVRGVIRILGTFTVTLGRLCYPDLLKLYYKLVLSIELVQSSFPIKISILFMPP